MRFRDWLKNSLSTGLDQSSGNDGDGFKTISPTTATSAIGNPSGRIASLGLVLRRAARPSISRNWRGSVRRPESGGVEPSKCRSVAQRRTCGRCANNAVGPGHGSVRSRTEIPGTDHGSRERRIATVRWSDDAADQGASVSFAQEFEIDPRADSVGRYSLPWQPESAWPWPPIGDRYIFVSCLMPSSCSSWDSNSPDFAPLAGQLLAV